MPRVAVITDSNSGITQQMGKDMGIEVVPMPFTIDDKTYYEDINLTREEFFQMMEDGKEILSSQPSPADLMKLWDKTLEKYDQIVYIPMSSGLSSSCQNARMIANEYNGKIRDILHRDKMEASIYIMLDTLKYLKKGGRITPAAAAIGTLMRIKPVLQIKGERLDAFSKARTLSQGKTIMINALHHDIDTLFGGIDADNVFIYAVHAQVPKAFSVFSDEVRQAFPSYDIEEARLSLSICCHIGPGALAMGCVKKCPEVFGNS